MTAELDISGDSGVRLILLTLSSKSTFCAVQTSADVFVVVKSSHDSSQQFWPDFRQLRGLVGVPSVNPRPLIRLVHRRAGSASQSSATGRHGRRVSTRLPLGQGQDGIVVMNRVSTYETGLLADLSGETGLSVWDWDGLFERCDQCGSLSGDCSYLEVMQCQMTAVMPADRHLRSILWSKVYWQSCVERDITLQSNLNASICQLASADQLFGEGPVPLD
ncbi:hypothetical protein F4604DRAFT_1899897 [Suillus subluteus]|nr:hypothetical protein F4604DRAFT_1899897 [Suillus subluteus]